SPHLYPDLHSFPTRRSSDLLLLCRLITVCISRQHNWLGLVVLLLKLLSKYFNNIVFYYNIRLKSQTCIKSPILVTVACIAIHTRSEEHTSELQSRENLVCRL